MSIEKIIKQTTDSNVDSINWTKAWSDKYPVLSCYQDVVDIDKYSKKVRDLFEELKSEYHYSEIDAMLILKDILYHEWKDKK